MNFSSTIKLNKEQKEAVEYGRGPLLIIAGAGTGKTTVITERVKYLISQNLAKPAEILALTFTDKAAREMEERIDIALPYGYTQMWILTFHAFCDRILRNEAVHIGLDPGYKLMSQAETVAFLRRNLFQFPLSYFRPLGNPTKFVQGIIQHFLRLKDEDITPHQYLDWIKVQSAKRKAQNYRAKLKTTEKTDLEKWQELALTYQKYEELKIKEGFMDFGDLISQTLNLFRRRKNLLKDYQKQFKYILVDEFQDTNIAQYELTKLLAPAKEKPNLTVVGDDSQSIYKFRGAAISNILSFMKDYPFAQQVVLIKNYRSSQTILDHAYQLIKHNDPDTLEAKLGINKNLISIKDQEGPKIKLISTDRVENEAEEVAKTINNLIRHQAPGTRHQYGDFAILVRANNHADPFIRALQRVGIPYQFLGPGMLFKQAEVKDLIAYLKVLDNFEDSISFYRVLTMPLFALSARDLTSLNIFARKYNLSLFEACEKIIEGEQKNYQFPPLSRKSREILTKIIKMIHRHLKRLNKDTAGQILYYFLEDSGLLKSLTAYKSLKEEKQAQNISRFFDKLKTYEVEREDASVAAVVDWLELSLQLGESPLASNFDWFDNNAVNILTVHSSKGLEFPVVFLVNLTAGRFPTYERREQIPIPEALIKEILPEGDYHLEEERRLFYVGMTRAMKRLYFSAANFYGEGKRERKLSPFVIEALGERMVKTMKQWSNETMKQLSFLDFRKSKEDRQPSAVSRQSIVYLSYSQLEIFNTCPLKYKYRYILKIPSRPSAAASFGQSIHETLKEFYQKVKKGEKPSKEKLINLLEESWSSLGYASKLHEERMKKEGEKMLEGFYEQAFNPQQIPQDLEQLFAIYITPTLKIAGRIDRVDRRNGKLEIIDYKTGRPSSQKEIDRSLQMSLYALAAIDKGIYGKQPEDLILSFYFLTTQEKISTKRTQEELTLTRKEIVSKAKEMERSSFEPRPGKHCDFCDYQFICPAWQQ